MGFSEKQLDKNVPIPLYFQLKELIVAAIKDGTYKKDNPIPTEKEFSEIFGISRTTVRQAITELVKEGWLYRVKSKGTFVSTPKINQDFISKLVTFQEEMDTSGKTAMTEVLELKVLPARDQIAGMLQLEVNDPVVYLHRRRFADGEPIVTVETFLSYADCAYVMERDLVKQSLYDIMSEKDETEVHCVKRRVEAVEATSDDSKLLGIKKGKPVQLFCSQGFNVYGKPVEYSVARYRADRNSFEVTVFADKKN